MIDPSRWQIRCLTCGLKRRARDAGIVRVGGWGRKYTIGWCSRCRWLRCAVVEATPERGFEVSCRRRRAGMRGVAEGDAERTRSRLRACRPGYNGRR